MKFILGKKEGMTQVFNEKGQVVPGTLVKAGPVYILETKKATQANSTESLVVGYDNRKLKNLKKPQRELLKKTLPDRTEGFAVIREFNNKKDPLPQVEIGQTIDVSVFSEGDKVVVSAISKGKGFQGVVKRHGFHGGRRSHGQKHSEREPGSIGAGGKQRVLPGLRMAGRMGGDRVTVKNLIIARVDKDNNQLFVRGAIPGRKGTLVEIIAQ